MNTGFCIHCSSLDDRSLLAEALFPVFAGSRKPELLKRGQMVWKRFRKIRKLLNFEIRTIQLSAVASNRPTEALASVISFTFVVYSHYKHS